MAIRVKLPNGQYGSFPDDMPHDQIESVLQKQFPKPESQSTGQYLKEDATNLGRNLLAGYLNMGRGFANFPHNLGKQFGLGDVFQPLAPQDYDYGKAVGLEPETENRAIQAVPEIAASFAIPGSTIPRMIAGQAAFGATQNENPFVGAAEGGAGAAVGAGLGKMLEKGMNLLRPSKMFRGELSPEELIANVKNTKGTETPLGEVIQSPSLKRVSENILPHVLGSGAEKTAQRTAAAVTKQGEELLYGMRGGKEVSENYGEKIKNALKEASQEAAHEKTTKFKRVNEIADQHGVTTDRSNLRNEAASILKQIKSDPDLAQFTGKADIKLLEEIVNPSNKINEDLASKMRSIKQVTEEPNYKGRIDLATGKPIETIKTEKNVSIKTPSTSATGGIDYATGKRATQPHNYSLKNTDILRGKIGQNAHEANVKGEKPKAEIYQRLKKALENDVGNAIEQSGIPELKGAHTEAMDFYKNKYAPFQDKDITKFVKAGGDPDLILGHFVRMGKADRSHILQKLKLSKGQEDLIGNAYLAPAYENGKLNPLKLKTLYQKLGKRQQAEIFGKENNQKLKSYTDLVHKNREGFNLMFNPKTGARLGHLGTAAAAVSHLPVALGAGAIGHIANKLLTSETFREKLIKAMIEDKKIKLPLATKALQKTGAASFDQGK
jgi:hypothetical protein